jgi:hypothetical protein
VGKAPSENLKIENRPIGTFIVLYFICSFFATNILSQSINIMQFDTALGHSSSSFSPHFHRRSIDDSDNYH